MIFRELKENEIPFAVGAYEDFLKDLQNFEEIQILPTRKTLDTIFILLKQNYKIGVKSYCVVDELEIVGYSLFVSDSLSFDTKLKTVGSLGIYVEPSHRNKSVAYKLIKGSIEALREKGYNRVYASFMSDRISSDKMIARFGFKRLLYNVCKDL